MRVIGITGQIGAGKSYVLSILGKNKENYVLESDRLAKELYSYGTDLYRKIVHAFGSDITIKETGEIDRKRLSAIVFSDEERLNKLNSLVHPAVKNEIRRLIEEKRKEGYKRFFIEAALLIQDGYKEICDEIWYVTADVEVRIERLISSRGYSREKCINIINSQPDDEYYMAGSDRIIHNNGSTYDLNMELLDIM